MNMFGTIPRLRQAKTEVLICVFESGLQTHLGPMISLTWRYNAISNVEFDCNVSVRLLNCWVCGETIPGFGNASFQVWRRITSDPVFCWKRNLRCRIHKDAYGSYASQTRQPTDWIMLSFMSRGGIWWTRPILKSESSRASLAVSGLALHAEDQQYAREGPYDKTI